MYLLNFYLINLQHVYNRLSSTIQQIQDKHHKNTKTKQNCITSTMHFCCTLQIINKHQILHIDIKSSMSRIRRSTSNLSIPLFIQKLSNILEDETCEQFIKWTSAGDAFNIPDINRFTDIVLPKYFKHSNFSSFIRQLNMYGFNKVRHDEGENVYMNQFFKRDQKQLLASIKRKINQTQKQDKVAVYSPASSNNLGKQLSDLKIRQRNLEGMCKQLIEQNNRILEENNLMMKKLTTEQKEKNSKMEQLLVSLIMARGSNQLALPSSQQSRMLTLANQTKTDFGQSNFQEFCEFLEDSNSNSRLQEALRKFQNEQKKRNKSKNYTIVNQSQHNDSSNNKSGTDQQQPRKQKQKQEEKSSIIKQPAELEKKAHEEHENSMLSLGDFLNLDSEPLNDNPQTPL